MEGGWLGAGHDEGWQRAWRLDTCVVLPGGDGCRLDVVAAPGLTELLDWVNSCLSPLPPPRASISLASSRRPW